MIPLHTTVITVSRVPNDPTLDGGDPQPAAQVIATGVRAVISAPSAAVNITSGDRVVDRFQLTCDPCDLRSLDLVVDAHGTTYTVDWAQPVNGFGLDHVTAALRIVEGAS